MRRWFLRQFTIFIGRERARVKQQQKKPGKQVSGLFTPSGGGKAPTRGGRYNVGTLLGSFRMIGVAGYENLSPALTFPVLSISTVFPVMVFASIVRVI